MTTAAGDSQQDSNWDATVTVVVGGVEVHRKAKSVTPAAQRASGPGNDTIRSVTTSRFSFSDGTFSVTYVNPVFDSEEADIAPVLSLERSSHRCEAVTIERNKKTRPYTWNSKDNYDSYSMDHSYSLESFALRKLAEMIDKSRFTSSTVSATLVYLGSSYTLIEKLLEVLDYESDISLARLFVPLECRKGKLRISDITTRVILDEVKEFPFECLEDISISGPTNTRSAQFIELVPKFSNLIKIKFSLKLFDIHLSLLGLHCRHLKYFDAKSCAVSITNGGLQFLAMCRDLEEILLPTHYGSLGEYRYNSHGILYCFMHLKNLSKFECDPNNMVETFHVMTLLKTIDPLKLTSMILGSLESVLQTPFNIPETFPCLDELGIIPYELDLTALSSNLSRLEQLRKLSTYCMDASFFDTIKFQLFGGKLTYLSLCVFMMSRADVVTINSTCPNLNTLLLCLCAFDNREAKRNFPSRLFPGVKVLEITSPFSSPVPYFMMSRMSSVKELYIPETVFSDVEFLDLLKRGNLQNIRRLIFPSMGTLDLVSVKVILRSLPSLEMFSIEATEEERKELLDYIKDNHLNVLLLPENKITRPSATDPIYIFPD